MTEYDRHIKPRKSIKFNPGEVGIFNRRTYAVLWLVFLAAMAVVVFISFTSVGEMRRVVRTEEEAYMREAATENARALKRGMDTQLEYMRRVLSVCGSIEDENDRREYLRLVQNNANETTFVYVRNSGEATDMYGREAILPEADVRAILSASGPEIFDSQRQGSKGEDTLAYAVPMDGAAFAAFQNKAVLEAFLKVESFGGTGYARVIDGEGTCVLTHADETLMDNGDNYFQVVRHQAILQAGFSADELADGIKAGDSGNFSGEITGYERKKLAYVPLGVRDWYTLIVIPASYSENRLTYYTDLLRAISILIPALLAVLLAYVVTLYQKSYRQVLYLAFRDTVTGGFNLIRGGIEEDFLLKGAKPLQYAYVIMDVRNFKLINDEFGIAQGNRALELIHDALRDDMGADESFCHVAGDLFYLLIENSLRDQLEKRLADLVDRINAASEADGRINAAFRVVWGVFPIDKPDRNMVTIRDRANIARKQGVKLETAKHSTCVFYDDLEHKRLMNEQRIVNQTSQAIENGEFVVYLQPKYDLTCDRFTSAEALVRWIKGGVMVMPDDFLPLFERNGFIVEIDRFVFTQVCALQRRWLDAGNDPVPIACNFTRLDFISPLFVESLLEIVNRYNVPTSLLELEITESMALESSPLIDRRIAILKQQGFTITIDDFGGGYSSLKRLLQINADVLKIDKSFFSGFDASRARNLISNMVTIAHQLNMRAVAEGVEYAEQVDYLRSIKCDMVQGYVFARPMPIGQYESFIAAQTEASDTCAGE